MKVLFISSSSGSCGGGEFYLLRLAEGLSRCGVQAELVASEHPRMDDLCRRFPGLVHRIPYRNSYDRPMRGIGTRLESESRAALEKILSANRYDLVHLNKQNLEDGLDLLSFVAKLDVPSVTTIHLTQSARYLKAKFAWIRDLNSRLSLRRYSGCYVVIDESRAKELAAIAGNHARIEAIPNGVDVPSDENYMEARRLHRSRLGLVPESRLAVAVGRMVEQKQVFRFLDWAESLLKLVPDMQFVWVGDGPLRSEWEVRARPLGNNSVRCVGWQEDVCQWLAAADLFLHPARYESFIPYAVLEAIAWRVPCILSEEVFEDVCPEEMSNSVIPAKVGWESRVLEEKTLQRIAQEALSYVRGNLSTEAVTRRYEALYEEVVSNGDPR